MPSRPGRPPSRPSGVSSTLTVRIPSGVKEYLIDTAAWYDMSITEYLLMLIDRDSKS